MTMWRNICIGILAGFTILSAGVTSPNGGEQICSRSTYTIRWTIDNPPHIPPPLLNKATIYFKRSSLPWATWETIADNISNTGTWKWEVPFYTTDQTTCRIRVKTPEYDDICDAVFTISGSNIRVTDPDSSEQLWPGETCNIRWDSECTSGNVKIELQTSGPLTSITGSTQDDGLFSWIVPDNPGSNRRIKISDTEGGLYDLSGPFIIKTPYIRVTSPSGGEVLRFGQPFTIRWDSRGTSGHFKIERMREGASTWHSIKDDTEEDGSFEWTPDVYGNYTIRISDVDGSPSDICDESFGIQYIRFDQLHWHSYHCPDSIWKIEWTSYLTSGHVNLLYSTTGDAPWTVIQDNIPDISGGSLKSYEWTVENTPSDNVRIKIEDSADPAFFDISDSEISIIASPGIHLSYPIKGDRLLFCHNNNHINWTSCVLDGTVLLELSTDNGSTWTDISTHENNEGYNEYSHWDLLDISSTSPECKVRITDLESGIFDESDIFSICVPTFEILTPNGGEIWPIGSTQEISWTLKDYFHSFGWITIYFSTNRGQNWSELTQLSLESQPDPWEGSFLWDVDAAVPESDQCLIKIELPSGPDPFYECEIGDVSDDVFTLCQKGIQIIKPDEGENLAAGEEYPITWDLCGSSGLLKIEFFPSGSEETVVVGENIPVDPPVFIWPVPDLHATGHRLKISDMSSDLFDVVQFNIRGGCTSPSIWVPDYRVCGFETIIVDVMLSGNENPISSFGFDLHATNYEMENRFLDVQKGDLTGNFENFTFVLNPNVEISASSSVPIPAHSHGVLARVVTRFPSFEGSSYPPPYPLLLRELEGDISIFNACDGLVEGDYCRSGDVNCDHVIDENDYHWVIDYFMSHFTEGYPECCSHCNSDVLDVFDDGEITLADARILYSAWENGTPPPLETVAPVPPEENIDIHLPWIECQLGDDIEIDLFINNPVNLSDFGLFLSYTTGFMSFQGIRSGSLTSDWDFLDAKPVEDGSSVHYDHLMLGGFNSEKITSGTIGTLMTLEFHVNEDAIGGCMIDVLGFYDGLKGLMYEQGHVSIAESSAMKLKDSRVPEEYHLGKAYPNPFNQNTRFDFELPERSNVRINIFDSRGSLVKTLVSKTLSPGSYQAEWDGMDNRHQPAASGQYIYQMKTDKYTAMEKCLLLK